MNTKLLRQKILDLAIRGKLTEQLKSDGTTKDLLKQISAANNADSNDATVSHAEPVSASKKKPKDVAKEIVPLDKATAPFEIPENWEWVRLIDIFNFIDYRGITPEKTEGGIPLITAKNVKKGFIDYSIDEYISEESFNSRQGRGSPKKGDILFTTEAPLGNVAIANLEKFSPGQRIITFQQYTDKDFFSNSYCVYYVMSDLFQTLLLGEKTGTTVSGIKSAKLKLLSIPLPPLAEQQRIVSAIETAFVEITEIEKNQELLKKHIKLGRQKILDLAIRGKLTQQLKTDGTTKDLLASIVASSDVILSEAKNPGKNNPASHPERSRSALNSSRVIQSKRSASKDPEEIIPLDKATAPFEIPENWEWVKLGDVGTWQSGTTPSKSNAAYYNNGTIPWLNTGDLNDGFVTDIPKKVTEKALQETSLRMNATGSVCIAMYGATIGKLGILSVPATTNQACCVCNNLKPIVEKMWLFYFLMNHKQEFIEAGFGGAQPNISKEKIISTPFPLPPLAEQQCIVAAIEQSFAEFDAMEKKL